MSQLEYFLIAALIAFAAIAADFSICAWLFLVPHALMAFFGWALVFYAAALICLIVAVIIKRFLAAT